MQCSNNSTFLFSKGAFVRFILISGAFLVFSSRSNAQYNFNSNCQHACRAILELRFSEAQQLIRTEKSIDGSNLIPLYLENYIDFLSLFIGEEPALYEKLKEKKNDRIKKLESGAENSPFYNFCLAQVNLQWALAGLKFGDYLSAAFEIRTAHALLTENSVKYPNFIINKTSLGVVHVLVSLVPDNYQWVTRLMGIDGKLEEGLLEIRQVAEYQGNDTQILAFKPEAIFYLAFSTSNLQKDKKEALSLLPMLNDLSLDGQPMKSPLLIFARVSILMKNGQNGQALNVLQERKRLTGCYPFYYLEYLEGLTRLNRLDDSAAGYFDRFLKNFTGRNYIRSAYQKLAWIAILKEDTLKFNQMMMQVKKMGASVVDEDKQAMMEAENSSIPNLILLRAKLLFDGGYYDLALKELLAVPVNKAIKTKRDFVEYTYRLARVYHESGNIPKALDFYQLAIERGKKEPFYFAAGSAFQMGLIYENHGLYAKADSAYRLCLSVNTAEYKTSLGEKARAGLNRVKKMLPKT